MKLLFDFLPILLFFIAFKFYGIFVATAVAMIACVLQIVIYWIKYRRFEPLYIITLIIVLALGSATLILHNSMIIKWKPTLVYWVLALLLFFTQFFGEKPLIQRLLSDKIELSKIVWTKLNVSWIIFFILMGAANLFVAYYFSTNTWVNFKVFGGFGLMLLMGIIQAIYIAKQDQTSTEKKSDV